MKIYKYLFALLLVSNVYAFDLDYVIENQSQSCEIVKDKNYTKETKNMKSPDIVEAGSKKSISVDLSDFPDDTDEAAIYYNIMCGQEYVGFIDFVFYPKNNAYHIDIYSRKMADIDYQGFNSIVLKDKSPE